MRKLGGEINLGFDWREASTVIGQLFSNYWKEIIGSFVFLYCLMGFFFGDVALINSAGIKIVKAQVANIVGVFLLCFLFLVYVVDRRKFNGDNFLKEQRQEVLFTVVLPLVLLFGFFVLLFTDVVERRFGFYLRSSIREELFVAGIVALVIVSGIKTKFFSIASFSLPLLLFCQFLCVVLYLQNAGDRLVFIDDHPNFLYRLQLLKDNFPTIPFYDTAWNAGYSAHEFYPSGMFNVFYMLLPFIYFIPDIDTFHGATFYTYIIPYLYIFVVPLCVYWAARILKFDSVVAAISGILAIVPTIGFLEWLLRFGTLGFSFSAGIFPLVFAFALRLLFDEKCRWWDVIGLLITSFLCFRWSLSMFAFFPLVVWALVKWKTFLLPNRVLKVLLFVAAFLILNVPWMLNFVDYSRVGSFVSGSNVPGSNAKSFSEAREGKQGLDETLPQNGGIDDRSDGIQHKFRELAAKINPLILLFFLPGLFAMKNREWRRTYLATMLWLMFMAGVGEQFKPQLELRRMIILFSFLAVIPAAAGIVYLVGLLGRLKNSEMFANRMLAQLGLIVVYGAIVMSSLTAASGYINRSDEKYRFAAPVVENLSIAIRKYGGDGRTFFLGFILHDLGASDYSSQDGGHVSPLAKFSGKPLYAMQYYHRFWSTIDPIPQEYRARGEEGIEEFLDLVNATAVVTFKREWADYCRSKSWYKEVFKEGRFRLFVRERNTGGYFLKGQGNVKAVKGGIAVVPDTTESVVKYHYLPRLRVQNKLKGVEIFPVKVFDEDRGGGRFEEFSYIGIRISEEHLKNKTEIRIGF